MIRPSIAVFVVLLFVSFFAQVHGYSVLSHEALIDAAWEAGIRPVHRGEFYVLPVTADGRSRGEPGGWLSMND
jgi:hypothetical protein